MHQRRKKDAENAVYLNKFVALLLLLLLVHGVSVCVYSAYSEIYPGQEFYCPRQGGAANFAQDEFSSIY